jgi:hypothetical protein
MRVWQNRKGRNGAKGEVKGWEVNIEGACGEIVVAKWRGEYWEGSVDQFEGGDVGKLQVKTTKHPEGCLLLRENAKDGEIFYLLTGEAPRFVIRGWAYGWEVKQDKYWRELKNGRPGAWFIPQSVLHEPEKELRVSVFA